MIIDFATQPYYHCAEAIIRPSGPNQFTGRLFLRTGKSFEIEITQTLQNYKYMPYVQAKVRLFDHLSIDDNNIDDFAKFIAKRAFCGDELFRYVKVDLRDGEMIFQKTWTRDFPDDEAIDEFLAKARGFAERYLAVDSNTIVLQDEEDETNETSKSSPEKAKMTATLDLETMTQLARVLKDALLDTDADRDDIYEAFEDLERPIHRASENVSNIATICAKFEEINDIICAFFAAFPDSREAELTAELAGVKLEELISLLEKHIQEI